MDNELRIRTELIDGRMAYRSSVDDHPPIVSDYTRPHGGDTGPTSLELFLVSLATCASSSVSVALRKMRRDVTWLACEARGRRRTEHPTGFSAITLELRLVSADATSDDLAEAVRVAEDLLCPVWSMIKGNVEVAVHGTIAPR